jgi:ABC-2 type transport system permease protein
MAAILWLKLKRMRQDAIMYIIMTFMAIFLTFVFGNAMFGGGGALRVYVVDNDGSAFSASFLESFDANAYALENKTKEEAESAVAKGEALAALIVPEGFENSTADGAEVAILRTADSADILMLENAVRTAYQNAAHVYRLHDELDQALSGAGMEAPSLETVRDEFAERMEDKPMTVSYTVLDAEDFDEKFYENIHYLMGFNIFFVMFSIVFTMGSILEDKKLRTWNRIRISPLSSRAVLAGNFIPAYVVGLLQMAIVLFLGQMLFGIDLGDALLPIFTVFAAFVLAASCLGLLLATAFKGIEQMSAAVPVIIVGTSMLGGCMWPLSIVGSDVLLGIAKAIPQYWALEAAERLAVYHVGFGDVLLNIGVLLGMALVLFVLSMLIYNKKQRA